MQWENISFIVRKSIYISLIISSVNFEESNYFKCILGQLENILKQNVQVEDEKKVEEVMINAWFD